MNAEWLNPLVQQLGWTLLHFIWQGMLVGLLFGLGLFALRGARASSRYAMAVGTLAVLAVLPAATFIVLGATAGTGGDGTIAVPAQTLTLVAGHNLGGAAVPELMLWIVAAWLTGVLVMASRLWLGWRYLVRLRRSADTAAAASLQPLLVQLCTGIGIVRQVQIALSNDVPSPVVIGWLKPLILLPPAVVNRMPLDQIEMVLAHELAHIRRHDHLVNLFQTAVETLLFYHPVVAWVSRRIRVERENACDDLVVHNSGKRLAYVEMLAALERMRFRGPHLALAMNDGQIVGRIRRLVEQARPRHQRGLIVPAMLLAAMVTAGVGIQLLPSNSDRDAAQLTDVSGSQPDTGDAPITEAMNAQEAVELPITTDSAAAFAPINAVAVQAPPAVAGPSETATFQERPGSNRLAQASPPPEDKAVAVREVRPESQPDQVIDRRPRGEAEQVTPETATTSRQTPSGSETAQDTATSVAAEPRQLASLPRNPKREAILEEPARVAIEPPPITGGELIRRVEPEYPSRAHRRQTGGQVELEFVVDRSGQVLVDAIEILRETPNQWRFGEAAVDAVAQWQFEPFRRADQALERTVRVEIVFEPDLSSCPVRTGTRIPSC